MLWHSGSHKIAVGKCLWPRYFLRYCSGFRNLQISRTIINSCTSLNTCQIRPAILHAFNCWKNAICVCLASIAPSFFIYKCTWTCSIILYCRNMNIGRLCFGPHLFLQTCFLIPKSQTVSTSIAKSFIFLLCLYGINIVVNGILELFWSLIKIMGCNYHSTYKFTLRCLEQ